jgi:hypothetical protein
MGQPVIEREIIHFFKIQCDTVAREIALFTDGSLRRNGPEDILHPWRGTARQPQEM